MLPFPALSRAPAHHPLTVRLLLLGLALVLAVGGVALWPRPAAPPVAVTAPVAAPAAILPADPPEAAPPPAAQPNMAPPPAPPLVQDDVPSAPASVVLGH